MSPSDSCRGPALKAGCPSSSGHPDRSPTFRAVPCVLAAPTTPAGGPVRFGSPGLLPAAFAIWREARRPRFSFRGLLRLHSRCGPYTCQPALSGLHAPGLRRVGRPSRRPGCYRGVPTTPRAGLTPAGTSQLRSTPPKVERHPAFRCPVQTPGESPGPRFRSGCRSQMASA